METAEECILYHAGGDSPAENRWEIRPVGSTEVVGRLSRRECATPMIERPDFPGALDFRDIRPGLLFRRHYEVWNDWSCVEEVVSEPFTQMLGERRVWAVMVRRVDEEAQVRVEYVAFLASIGVMPYVESDGRMHWNQMNCVTRAA